MPLLPEQPIKWLRGDARWASASPLASYAPLVVMSLLILSIIEICTGAAWVSKMSTVSFQLMLQPLVLPCISLFNTVPSAHLHLYTHHNNPRLAIWFSAILGVLYVVSAILALAACSGPHPIRSLIGECPTPLGQGGGGPQISQTFWNACVAMWLLSGLGYLVVVFMALKVLALLKKQELEARGLGLSAGTVEMMNMEPEERARREQKARERWQRIVDL